MARIVPHLWFRDSLAEAIRLYTGLIPNSRIVSESSLDGTPSGSVAVASFVLGGMEVQALAAPSPFHLNPTFSLLVACEGPAEVDRLHAQLSPGGSELMPLGAYPFSPRYVWVVDRFGLSWQIMDFTGRQVVRRVTPTLMFTGPAAGHCREAIESHVRLFPGSSVGNVEHYGPGMAHPIEAQHVKYGSFALAGTHLAAMDNAAHPGPHFNEAASLMVFVDTQYELDRLWTTLSANPEEEQCGWLKDRFGLSWQVLPEVLVRIMSGSDSKARARMQDAFMPMKKLDIAALEAAARG
jgi:predicted 3-demethylubiquinone-9 3-methyltransferase (glyoxalase superfamily)